MSNLKVVKGSDRLDLVIFGASGYTGRFVIPEMFRICKKYPDISWAIAGRSYSKLEAALQDAAKVTGQNVSKIKIILADAEDEESLIAMCTQCKLVMNCSGPFLRYGEALVKAAIECKTDYIDVCSEPPFLEKVLKTYDDPARDNGVFVINACGLGCLLVDLGVVFLQQQFQGTMNSVEAYLTTQPKAVKGWPSNVIRNSTWEAMIHATVQKPLWKTSDTNSKIARLEPELKSRSCIHKRFNRWCVPFPGAEESVVQRTQNFFKPTTRPVQFKRYHSLPSLISSLVSSIGGYIMFILLKICCLSGLFIKYPRLFSLGVVTYGDPDEAMMKQLAFDYQLVGLGWKGQVQGAPKDKIMARVYPIGKKNSPYEGTAVAAIYSAITLLTERDKLPTTCGVLTPGAAFKNTTIIEKFNKDNLRFEIVNA